MEYSRQDPARCPQFSICNTGEEGAENAGLHPTHLEPGLCTPCQPAQSAGLGLRSPDTTRQACSSSAAYQRTLPPEPNITPLLARVKPIVRLMPAHRRTSRPPNRAVIGIVMTVSAGSLAGRNCYRYNCMSRKGQINGPPGPKHLLHHFTADAADFRVHSMKRLLPRGSANAPAA